MAEEYVKQCPTCGDDITTMEVDMGAGTIKFQCGHTVPTSQYSVHVEKDLVGHKVGRWVIHHDEVAEQADRHLYVPEATNLGEMWDYTSRPMSYATMKQQGCRVISRYLSPPSYGAWKNLTAAEAQEIRANGLDIRSNWEGYADFRNDPRYPGDPYGMGRLDGAMAYQMHRNCGGPDWAGIVFSFDVSDLDGPTCERYLLGVFSLGLPMLPDWYGKHGLLDYLNSSAALQKARADNAQRAPWMTSSWNYNAAVATGTATHQYYYANAYDASHILTDYYGGWSQAGEDDMNFDDFKNGIISVAPPANGPNKGQPVQGGMRMGDIVGWGVFAQASMLANESAQNAKLDALATALANVTSSTTGLTKQEILDQLDATLKSVLENGAHAQALSRLAELVGVDPEDVRPDTSDDGKSTKKAPAKKAAATAHKGGKS